MLVSKEEGIFKSTRRGDIPWNKNGGWSEGEDGDSVERDRVRWWLTQSSRRVDWGESQVVVRMSGPLSERKRDGKMWTIRPWSGKGSFEWEKNREAENGGRRSGGQVLVGPEPWTSVDFLDLDFNHSSYYDSSYDSSDSYYDMILFFFIIFYTKKGRRQPVDEFSATEAKKNPGE